MDQYDLFQQVMQMNQQMPQGQGMLMPQVEVQQKVKQPVEMAAPIQAVFAPKQKFPTSADEFNEYVKRTTQGLTSQREGLAGIESQIAELSKPQQEGITKGVLFALSDMFGGTDLMKNYQSPAEKAKAQKAQALGLQMQLQKSKNDLTDKEIDLFKAQYQDSLGREKMASEESMFRAKLGADAAKEAGKTPDLKDWQVQSATYGKRLQQAEDVFGDLESKGYDRGTFGEGAKDLLSGLPGAGHLTNELLKRQQQAERNFVTATLRKESGAAISNSEFKNAEQQYFPRAGDTPEVLAQKRANRKQVIEGMKLGAGPAWAQLPQIASEVGAGTAPAAASVDKLKRLQELRAKAGK